MMPTTRSTRRSAARGPARATIVAAIALFALLCGACGNDDDTAGAVAGDTATTSVPADGPAPDSSGDTSTTSVPVDDPAPDSAETSTASVAADDAQASDAALAASALLTAEEVGEGWVSNGTALVFPMDIGLAADVATCAPFLDTVFEGGNDGAWSSTSYSRNIDVALSSVIVFPSEEGAIAMVDAMASDEFDPCWADFSEVAVMQLTGADAVTYESVAPPQIEPSGDRATINALVGTLTFGETPLPDSCVCAVEQVGRAVVLFDAAEPVFTAAARRDVLVRAAERLGEVVG